MCAVVDEASARRMCLSPGVAQQYSGDWPLAHQISDTEVYLRSVGYQSISTISDIASVSGCVSEKAGLNNRNISDLVTYTADLTYRGQRLRIRTHVWGSTIMGDTTGGSGAAFGTVVCYADQNDRKLNYRCNLLAKPAEIVLLTASDMKKRGVVGGGANFLGNINSSPRAPLRGLSMLMSRRDLSADSSLKWAKDQITTDSYNLTLPPGYSYRSNEPQLAVTRVDAAQSARPCSQQVALYQSLASEVLGGATFSCHMWGDMQIYSNLEFSRTFERLNSVPPADCAGMEVTTPYAVLTQHFAGLHVVMTIWDGSNHIDLSNNLVMQNAISCFKANKTAIDSPGDRSYNTFLIITGILNIFQPQGKSFFRQLEEFDRWKSSNATDPGSSFQVVCALGSVQSGSANPEAVVLSDEGAEQQLDNARELHMSAHGIARASRNTGVAPCKILPQDEGPFDYSPDPNEKDLGKLVDISIAYSFSYTFNRENRRQFDAMASDIISQQSSAGWGIVLTTCLATVIASLAVPAKLPHPRIHHVVRAVIVIVLIILEAAAGNSAAALGLWNLYNLSETTTGWTNTDSGGSRPFIISFISARTMVTLNAQMASHVPSYMVKLGLLIASMGFGTCILLVRWIREVVRECHNSSASQSASPNAQMISQASKPCTLV